MLCVFGSLGEAEAVPGVWARLGWTEPAQDGGDKGRAAAQAQEICTSQGTDQLRLGKRCSQGNWDFISGFPGTLGWFGWGGDTADVPE